MVIDTGAFANDAITFTTPSTTTRIVEDGILYSDDTKQNAQQVLTPKASYVAPSSLTTVLPEVFSGQKILTSVDFSAVGLSTSFLYLGSSSFANTGITSITFPTKPASSTYGMIIDSYAFSYTALTSLTLSDAVIGLSDGVFANCTSLKHADLSKASVNFISNDLFSGDTALEDVILPAGIQHFNNGVFAGCSSLKAIYLMDTSLDTNVYGLPNYAGDGWNCTDSETQTINYEWTYSYNYADYYLYSEEKPLMNASAYWHYVDGQPTIWKA